MKKILGLDLGTNSIGWALVESNFDKKEGQINGVGSRIIPMTQDVLDNFGSGQSHSQTSERTNYRGTRRLYQRDVLRRERLHRVLNILDFLPQHYKNSIDFKDRIGQFKEEIKLNYYKGDDNKYHFLFMDSFNEMVEEFKKEQPQLFYKNKKGEETKIPYDWTIYYLRKKALSKKISKEELSWLLLNFNQKRGYYQLRGEEEEIKEGKIKTFEVLKISKVEDSGEVIKKSGDKLFDVYFENGWKYDKQTTKPNDWLDKTKEFIVTESKLKGGTIKRTYKSVDSEKDWIAIKEKTQKNIKELGKTVGTYIYETLLKKPTQKINGKLIRTIERKFYKEELQAILENQIQFHPELKNKELYKTCIEELYTYNESHKNNILNKEENKMFQYLFMEDIIFYQRPLKSKKSTISGCQYEIRKYKKKNKEGAIETISEPLKVISKSNPIFIEFRLWQFLRNLKIYKIEGKSDIDITNQCLQNEEEWCDLFDSLNNRKEVEQKTLIDYFIKKNRLDKAEKENYRWNYVVDKKYPMNETRSQFITRLKKVAGIQNDFILDKETEQKLWHIIYSVKDKNEFKKALKTFAEKNNFDVESFVLSFEKFPPFKSEYGSYSEKAIKKLLPFMRVGRYWNEKDLNKDAKDRIELIIERIKHLQIHKEEKVKENALKEAIALVSDDEIPSQFIKSFLKFKDKNPLSGLNIYQACYAVYERHSEVSVIQQWKKPEDIDTFLNQFKQHSLRNPIVEQVILETLRTVRDIWSFNLEKDKDFKFSEIHLELGRDMKNPKDKREKISKRQTENENTNDRIKLLLEELKASYSDEDIRPFSPSHQEILKIYEEGVYQNPKVSFNKVSEDDITKIRRNSNPTPSEITRYKLWLDQNYISPYTGQPIPLSKLFSSDYQIEHIIPQSRYFDNSLSNKVICESAINPNPYKDNQTGYEFIKNMGGQIVPELSNNQKTVKLFTLEEYESHCENYFKKNRAKLKYLLSEDIPEGFINRQMNDSRYISKYVKALLSNIVRTEDEKEATAKNLIPISGSITSKLKQDWGLNDKWNELVEPRFKRLNKLTKSQDFGYLDYQKDDKGNKTGKKFFRLVTPKGISKKRIDHRHHALDALVIACATRKHIQYLNSLSNENKKYELQPSLLVKNKEGNFTKHFQLPWSTFPVDAKNNLEQIIVSFKKNIRVLTKTNNKYWSYKDEQGNLRLDKSGNPKKELTRQIKGDSRAIRKPLHKEFVYKKLNHIQTPKNKIATAIRTDLSAIKTEKHIDAITDESIKKILVNHLDNYIDENNKKRFDLAFSPEGVEELNKNIDVLNNGKRHKPIYKVRIYEIGSRFSVSENENSSKNKKYVEAAKGTNLFFAIYWNKEKQKREFDTIPLNIVIERLKQKQSPVPEKYFDKKNVECDLLFYLSPNDLVYVPAEDEIETPHNVDFNYIGKEQVNRIYKMVSATNTQCFFIENRVASSIKNKLEFSALNKMERSIEDVMIKNVCWKLKIDRLGNIVSVVK
jgi:CRISPR-associated endonuclease Csn1